MWEYKILDAYSADCFTNIDKGLRIIIENISEYLDDPLKYSPQVEQLILGEPSMCHSLEANRNAQGVYDWASTVEEYAPDGLTEEALRKHCERSGLTILIRNYRGYRDYLDYALIAPNDYTGDLRQLAHHYEAWLSGAIYQPMLQELHTIRDENTGESWTEWVVSDFQPPEFVQLIAPTATEIDNLPELVNCDA
jgi:hypothetical protein